MSSELVDVMLKSEVERLAEINRIPLPDNLSSLLSQHVERFGGESESLWLRACHFLVFGLESKTVNQSRDLH